MPLGMSVELAIEEAFVEVMGDRYKLPALLNAFRARLSQPAPEGPEPHLHQMEAWEGGSYCAVPGCTYGAFPPAAPRLPLESEVVGEMLTAFYPQFSDGARFSPTNMAGMTAALRVAEKWLLRDVSDGELRGDWHVREQVNRIFASRRASPAPEGGERVTVSEDETWWIVRVEQGQTTSFPKNGYSRTDRDAFAEALRGLEAAKEKL